MTSPQLPNAYGPAVTLAAARAVANAAVARAAASGWKVAVAVVDPGGDLVHLVRMDETQKGSVDVAIEKARCAARFKRPTKAWEERLPVSPAILRIPGVLPLEGGVPLLSNDLVVGAVGVSGATSAEDGECAEAGRLALERNPPRDARQGSGGTDSSR